MAFRQPGVAQQPAAAQVATDDRSALEPFVEHFGAPLVRQVLRMAKDAVDGITRRRSFFRTRDIEAAVRRMGQKELSAAVMEDAAFASLLAVAAATLNLEPVGATGTFTTRQMVETERAMLRLATASSADHMLPEAIVAKTLRDCKDISEEQVRAVLAASRTRNEVTVIEGAAGSGKSFTMRTITKVYTNSGYAVMGTALGWNAAKVLQGAAGIDRCVAIEGLVRKMEKAAQTGVEFFSGPTLLIVDEAGMVGVRHMHSLLHAASRSRYPVKVVLTGDSLQVNPVDAGNALEAIVEFCGTTRINAIRRQHQQSHRLAVAHFSQRRAGYGLYPYWHQEAIQWCADETARYDRVVRDYLSYRLSHPQSSALVLALRNKDVTALNERLRAASRRLGMISGREVQINVTDGRESWRAAFAVGDEVVLRTNDADLIQYRKDPKQPPAPENRMAWEPIGRGVFNRNSGKIVALAPSRAPLGSWDMTIDIEGDHPSRVVVNSERFRHPDRPGMAMVHNFATTIYASQGQTVDRVFLLDSPLIEFRLAYVAMSRHRDAVDVYLDETELHDRLDRAVGRVQEGAPTRAQVAAQIAAEGAAGRDRDATPQAPVRLGRYTRTQMLQAVACSWSRDSRNLTALMYERRRRLGEAEAAQHGVDIGPASLLDPVTDFLPRTNQPQPLIDIKDLLSTSAPLENVAMVGPSAIAAPDHAPSAHPAGGTHRSGWISRAMSWVLSAGPATSVEAAPAENAVPDPFAASTPPAPPPAPAPAPKSSHYRWLPARPSIGAITAQGLLDFTGVPQTDSAGGPSPESIAAGKGVWWDVGRGGEPRILARDAAGLVAARYRLDGECVVGDGYPPILANRKAASDTPVYILPGAKEWAWMAQTLAEKNAATPEKIPHMVWAAREADWSHLVKALSSRPLFIVRSRTHAGQANWARELQATLARDFGLSANIVPSLPSPSPPPAGASRLPRVRG